MSGIAGFLATAVGAPVQDQTVTGKYDLHMEHVPRTSDAADRHARAAHTPESRWTSISSGSTPATAGSGNRPAQFAQPQKIAVVELSSPLQAPMVRGLTWSA